MINFENEKELKKFIQSELLFTSEAVEILNCSRQYISQIVKSGLLEPVKTSGKERIFLKSDVVAFDNRRKSK